MKILVSACLLGIDCKYNGKNNKNDKIIELLKDHELIPVCPEIMGGLPTPRIPAEIHQNKVIAKDGKEIDKPIYTAAQGGRRGRTVIGTKIINGEKRLCFYVTKDGSIYASKPEKLAKLLVKSGWKDAVMLDSGGSSQYYSKPDNRRVYTPRINGHYILVYLK